MRKSSNRRKHRKIKYQCVTGVGEKIYYRFVDKPMRPLIRALNAMPDVATFACCEGHGVRGQFYLWMGAKSVEAIQALADVLYMPLVHVLYEEVVRLRVCLEPSVPINADEPRNEEWVGLRVEIENFHMLDAGARERYLLDLARRVESKGLRLRGMM